MVNETRVAGDRSWRMGDRTGKDDSVVVATGAGDDLVILDPEAGGLVVGKPAPPERQHRSLLWRGAS